MKFDFNKHQLASGSKILNKDGVVLYEVIKTLTPEWENPCADYLNDCLWVTVKDIAGEIFSQPVQWFNAVIGANEGIRIVQIGEMK